MLILGLIASALIFVRQWGTHWMKAHQIVSLVKISWCEVKIRFLAKYVYWKILKMKEKVGKFTVFERVYKQFQFFHLNDTCKLQILFSDMCQAFWFKISQNMHILLSFTNSKNRGIYPVISKSSILLWPI